MGSKSSAPSADPNVGIVLLKQAATGDRLLDFVMQSYQDNQPLVQEAAQNARADRIRQNRLADQAEQRSNDSYNFYQTQGRPVIEQSLNDAKNWDNEGNVSKARSEAIADTTAQFDAASTQQNRALARMGVNPNSGKFAALNNQIAVQKAAAMAGASGNAANQLKLQGATMRANASNIANGFSSGSLNFAGQGSGMGVQANGMAGQPLGFAQSTQNQYTNGLGQAGNMFGSNANGYQNLSNYNLNAAQMNNEAAGGFGQLVGTLGSAAISKWKDGGMITGPGTGTSDSVPAVNTSSGQPIRLSNGEYVISADVVKAKGQEFFDKLQQRYHQNGNIRRAA